MRITKSNALLALSAATMSAAPAGAFVFPAPHMAAAGHGAGALPGSKPLLPRPLASKLGQRDVTVQQTKSAKVRGGAAAPLGATALPTIDGLPLRGETSDKGKQNAIYRQPVDVRSYVYIEKIKQYTVSSCRPKPVCSKRYRALYLPVPSHEGLIFRIRQSEALANMDHRYRMMGGGKGHGRLLFFVVQCGQIVS